MKNLGGQVAVVTGGTFGVGRGIASVLAPNGARVFVTGRSALDGVSDDGQITGIRCDHRVDAEVSTAPTTTQANLLQSPWSSASAG